jgi:hypothetical protein
LPVAPPVALERDQKDDDHKHEAGQLGGPRKTAAIEPGGEDRQRERRHAEIFAGANVVERLQQRERDTDCDGGPRQRQRDPQGELPRSRAEHARCLDVLGTLSLQHRARCQVDVGVEHEADHDDRTAERAHVGKPVVGGGAPAGERAQC